LKLGFVVTRGEKIRRVQHELTGDREIHTARKCLEKRSVVRLVHDEGLTMSLM
jgi:hypothetical protein